MSGVDPSERRAEGGVADTELVLDLSGCLLAPSDLETNEEETQLGGDSWSQDGDWQECGRLESRWILWREFMAERAHLDAWLRSAERAVASRGSAAVPYAAAKEELRRFERLRREAGSQLVLLDSLTQRNRTLAGLFQGVMQARLLGAARECGRRWDDVSAQLESAVRGLTGFVSEWEEFEAEGEELALWLADLDVRLTEVHHLNGSTCEKLRRLQSFHRCVCVNSSRVNALLQRGEALIQSSDATDAQHVESRLLELLRRCSQIYNNIARTHTRLLSMRLVFEDDWILTGATDSGCPSETVFEEEVVLDGSSLDLPAAEVGPAPCCRPPAAPPSPAHDHQGLEWDPSVDIGRSVACDDADSSYFSAGVCPGDGLRRRGCVGSLGSRSDPGSVTYWEPEPCLDHDPSSVLSPTAIGHEGARLPMLTSTPNTQASEPIAFDGGRVRAWLGLLASSCSKAVQTDGEAEESSSRCEEPEPPVPEQSSSSVFLCPPLRCLCAAAALLMLAYLAWVSVEPPCHRGNAMHRSFHLALSYVNGPPPT